MRRLCPDGVTRLTASKSLAGVSTGDPWAWSSHVPQHEDHQPVARPRPAHADRGAGRTDADLPGPDRRRPSGADPERRQRRASAPSRSPRPLRSPGGVPDVVTPAIGRASAILKATFEQAAPFEEALLQRPAARAPAARPRHLPQGAGRPGRRDQGPPARREAHHRPRGHRRVADRGAGRGGHGWPRRPGRRPRCRRSPAVSPARSTPRSASVANTVNNAVDTVQHAGEETSERLSAVTDRAAALTDAVRETLTAGRSASLRKRAEQIARREGNKDAAKAAKSAREELGDVSRRRAADQELRQARGRRRHQGDQGPEDAARTSTWSSTTRRATRTGRTWSAPRRPSLADLAKEAVGVSSYAPAVVTRRARIPCSGCGPSTRVVRVCVRGRSRASLDARRCGRHARCGSLARPVGCGKLVQ